MHVSGRIKTRAGSVVVTDDTSSTLNKIFYTLNKVYSTMSINRKNSPNYICSAPIQRLLEHTGQLEKTSLDSILIVVPHSMQL
jgi:hypothetical protein